MTLQIGWRHEGANWQPNPLLLHWVLNPGVAFNEVVLGQCIPKEYFTCKRCPFGDRCYIRCPSCDSFHSGMLWARGNAFGHWFGLICPRCGVPIPRLWNLVSIVVLMVTAPVWWLPVRAWKAHYIRYERLRARAVLAAPVTRPRPHWLVVGLMWALLSGTLFSVVFPMFAPAPGGYLVGVGVCLLCGFPTWLLGGVAFGALMKRFGESRSRGFRDSRPPE
jgi:hypothetical protein